MKVIHISDYSTLSPKENNAFDHQYKFGLVSQAVESSNGVDIPTDMLKDENDKLETKSVSTTNEFDIQSTSIIKD